MAWENRGTCHAFCSRDLFNAIASTGASLIPNPIIGNVVDAYGKGVPGVTVNLLNSANASVSTATSDVTGFYYFPATGSLASGGSYTIDVLLPNGYKNSAPSSRSFTWKATKVALTNFVLN